MSNTAREAPAAEPSVTYVVEKRPDGGVIEVKGNRALAESSVRDYMIANCGRDAYRVEREEQVPYQLTDGTPATAWRIYYRCLR